MLAIDKVLALKASYLCAHQLAGLILVDAWQPLVNVLRLIVNIIMT
jgi:hypothetical protein